MGAADASFGILAHVSKGESFSRLIRAFVPCFEAAGWAARFRGRGRLRYGGKSPFRDGIRKVIGHVVVLVYFGTTFAWRMFLLRLGAGIRKGPDMVWNSWGKGASVLGFASLAGLLTPALAFASESTYIVEGNVTVSLQSSQAASAAASTAALAKTGDAVLWLMLGIVAIGACAIAAMRASGKIASSSNGTCESAQVSCRGFLAVIVACTLAAALSFGQFAASAAYAAEELAGVACNGQVVVDENGKVVSSDFKISNGSAGDIRVKSIQAPESLSGWSATAPEAAIKASGEYAGAWNAKDISPEMLQQLKSNNNELALHMTATVAVAYNTVSFDTCGIDVAVDDQTVQENATATMPAEPVCSDYEFVGWYVDKDYTQAFDFSTPIASDITLYAKWSVKGYWLAAPDAQDPAASVLKPMSEIDADVAAIKNGDSATIEEYSEYLADDSVHLYTRWNGSTVDVSGKAQAANEYAEFRIIQVGNHDDEGCNITFQATHLLPEAAAMNGTDTNTGGWGATELRASMQQGGAIYESFDADFTDKILTVSKASSKGDLSADKVYSQDKFWVLCYSEYTGAGIGGTAAYEGSQYRYWANMGVSYDASKKWECLKFATRAGNNPANVEMNTLRFWERSPLMNENWTGSFCEVYCPDKVGTPAYGTTASTEIGVALAFCF